MRNIVLMLTLIFFSACAVPDQNALNEEISQLIHSGMPVDDALEALNHHGFSCGFQGDPRTHFCSRLHPVVAPYGCSDSVEFAADASTVQDLTINKIRCTGL